MKNFIKSFVLVVSCFCTSQGLAECFVPHYDFDLKFSKDLSQGFFTDYMDVHQWDIQTGKIIKKFKGRALGGTFHSPINELYLSDTDKFLVGYTRPFWELPGVIRVWNTSTGQEVYLNEAVEFFDISLGADRIAFVAQGKNQTQKIVVFDLSTKKIVYETTQLVGRPTLSRDGNALFVLTRNYRIQELRRIDLSNPNNILKSKMEYGNLYEIDGLLYGVGYDFVKLFNSKTLATIKEIPLEASRTANSDALQISSAKKLILNGSNSVHSLEDGEHLFNIGTYYNDPLIHGQFSAEGDRLAASFSKGKVRIFNSETGALISESCAPRPNPN